MIISDEHRYLFVELPWTASTAISKELREYYGGRSILRKHSNYREFLRQASAEQRSYFTFSGIRHPLDELVSVYVKFVNNPSLYTNPEWWVSRRKIRRFLWVRRRQASFSEFVRRFYWLPAETWSSLDHKRLDFVYRFENVVSDFETVLRTVDLEPVRELPSWHRTAGKGRWQEYYTPDLYDRVRIVFGPRMAEWGYEFPPEWNVDPEPAWAKSVYTGKAALKNACRRVLSYVGPGPRAG